MFSDFKKFKGQVTRTNGERVEAINSGTAELVAGDAVTIDVSTNNIIAVKKATTADVVCGFVISEVVNKKFKKGDMLTYADCGTYIYLVADGAIASGDKLMLTADGVAEWEAAVSPNPNPQVIGRAVNAAADEGLVEVKLLINE